MVTSGNRKLVRKYLGDTMVENAFTSGVDFKRYFLSMIDLKKLRIQIIALTYEDRFRMFTAEEISFNSGVYQVDNRNHLLKLKDPNFSFNEFRSNLVARWEYLPGSTLCLVWEHNRSNRDDIYQTGWGK